MIEIVVITLSALLWLFRNSRKQRVQLLPNEKTYLDIKTDKIMPWPTVFDEPMYKTSIIIPAYNESKRLPKMLLEAFDYLEKSKNPTEIIIVNDGSTDDTVQVAEKFGLEYLNSKYVDFKIMNLQKNRGKGGAVTLGIMASLGKNILFVDADGASKFDNYSKLEKSLNTFKNGGVAIGSRAHMVESDAVVKRSKLRNFLMYSFHTILYLFGIASIKDTQCGFKAFTRNAAANIFSNMHVTGWIFDIEVLLLAQYLNFPIDEIPIQWHEVDGTKMNLAKDSFLMLKDLILIRINYILGLWDVKKRLG